MQRYLCCDKYLLREQVIIGRKYYYIICDIDLKILSSIQNCRGDLKINKKKS